MSLRFLLAVTLGVVVGITAVLLSLTAGQVATASVRSRIEAQLADAAFQMRDKLDRSMFERYREIQNAASHHDVFQPGADRERQRVWLQRIKATFPAYAWVGFAHHEGEVIAATDRLLEGMDVSARPWFRASRDRPHASDRHEVDLLRDLLAGTANEELRFIDVAAPVILPGGRLVGVLGAHVRWSWLEEIRRSVMAAQDASSTVDILVLSDTGTILLGPRRLVGRTVDVTIGPGGRAQVSDWPDGGRYLLGYSKSVGHLSYPGLGWQVLAREDARIAERQAADIWRSILGIGALISACVMLLGWLAARRIALPLEQLTEAAANYRHTRSMGNGPTLGGYREVETLARTCKAVLGELSEREQELRGLAATLEERVNERTVELARANAGLAESRARIQSIFDSVSDALLTFGRDGRILAFNRATGLLFGRSDGALRRCGACEMLRLPSGSPVPLGEVFDGIDTGREVVPVTMEALGLRADGAEFPVEVTVTAARLDHQAACILSVRDISQRKEVERLKAEFIATVSHELRTPLTAIRAALGLVMAQTDGLPDKQIGLLRIAARNTGRLVALVDDILDMEKIEAGKMAFVIEPADLGVLISEAVEANRTYASARAVTLRGILPSARVVAPVDPQRLHQVLANLISNAVKFSPEGGEVTISLGAVNGQAMIEVHDAGPGVPQDFRSRIFQKFAQAPGEHAPSGTGLGLSISKAIVERHGGEIDYSSRPGSTTFRVILPLSLARAA